MNDKNGLFAKFWKDDIYSAAPAAWRAAKRNPIPILKKKDFIMVIMAIGIARGVYATATMMVMGPEFC